MYYNIKIQLPRSGILDLTFTNSTKLREKGEISDSITHFELDLSYSDHHHMALLLIERGMRNPVETWLNCTLDDEIFDISEDPLCAYSFIETRLSIIINIFIEGIFKLDYITATLPCNPHYELDLSITDERMKATKLLDRMYFFL